MASKRRSRASSQFLNTSLGSSSGSVGGRARPAPLQRSQSSVSAWSGWSGGGGTWGGPATPRLVKPASEYPENFRKIVENFQKSVERDCQRKPRSRSTPSIPNSGTYDFYDDCMIFSKETKIVIVGQYFINIQKFCQIA